LKNFYNRQNKNLKYTKIEINTPSKFLTDDLRIDQQVPIKTYYSTFVVKHLVIITIFFLIISSFITGILIGWIVFKSLRKNILKLWLIGLSNCLSIFGLLIITVLVDTKDKVENIDVLLIALKRKGYFWKRRLALILLLANLSFLVISISVIPSLIRNLAYLFGSGYFSVTGELLVILISVALLAFSLILKRIKPEDKNLFEQLKSANYSTWSFAPKDKLKIAFVPVFSISFFGYFLANS
jgi:hypothetical protein